MSKSTSETGHSVNISNFKLLADYCGGFGDKYNPSNEDLMMVKLLELWTKGRGRRCGCIESGGEQ